MARDAAFPSPPSGHADGYALRYPRGQSAPEPGPGSHGQDLMSHERRQAPRVEILGRVSGRSITLDVDVHVREISLGGMSIETAFPLLADARHEFQLRLGDGSAVDVVARVRYSRPQSDGTTTTYVSGLEFVDEPPPDSPLTIEDLLDRIK